MAFKFVGFFALLAVSNAGFLPTAQVHHTAPTTVVKTISPVEHHYATQPLLAETHEEFDPHPQYQFGYNVHDNLSGDSKSQVEERDGDMVRGEYSLIDADGYKRTVKYTADDHNGFNAVVEREPLVKTVAAAPTVVAPVAHYAAPTVIKTVASPVSHYTAAVAHYTAPAVVKTVAPIAHYTAPVAHYEQLKSVAPVAHYASPAVVKTLEPVAHYTAPAYATYSAPAHYVTHH